MNLIRPLLSLITVADLHLPGSRDATRARFAWLPTQHFQ